MTYSSLTDEGHYRSAQQQEEEKLAYILDIIDRMRDRGRDPRPTAEDIAFLEREMTQYITRYSTRPLQGK